jgi:hypothetical protein
LVLVLVAVGIAVVAAQDDTAAQPFGSGGMWGRGAGFGGRGFGIGPDGSLVGIVADELGLDWSALGAELQDGKTIAEVAEEQGVALETLMDAATAAHTERLNALVENGVLTQEEADSRLELMSAHFESRLSGTFTPENLGQGFRGQGRPFGPKGDPGAGPGRGNRWS